MGGERGAARFNPEGVHFPSDAITLGQMRSEEPHLFHLHSLDGQSATGIEALATHHLELGLAENAFARALGRPMPKTPADRPLIIEMLNRAYMRYGVSSGMQQTKQLVRDFEAAAARQAEELRGTSR